MSRINSVRFRLVIQFSLRAFNDCLMSSINVVNVMIDPSSMHIKNDITDIEYTPYIKSMAIALKYPYGNVFQSYGNLAWENDDIISSNQPKQWTFSSPYFIYTSMNFFFLMPFDAEKSIQKITSKHYLPEKVRHFKVVSLQFPLFMNPKDCRNTKRKKDRRCNSYKNHIHCRRPFFDSCI